MRQLFFIFSFLIFTLGLTAEEYPAFQVSPRARVSEWLPADADKGGNYPLILFSHGWGGSGTQAKFLCQALADHGYVVLAIDHADAMVGSEFAEQRGAWQPGALVEHLKERMQQTGARIEIPAFGRPDTWDDTNMRRRAEDLLYLLDYAQHNSRYTSIVDFSRIGLMGHSLGGYGVLGLAGAWPSWKDDRFKCVLALAPYVQPYLDKNTLDKLEVPVMYQAGTRDIGTSPYLRGEDGAYAQSAPPKYLVDLDGATHFAWTDFVPQYQEQISAYAVAFFDKYLKEAPAELLNAPPMNGLADYQHEP